MKKILSINGNNTVIAVICAVFLILSIFCYPARTASTLTLGIVAFSIISNYDKSIIAFSVRNKMLGVGLIFLSSILFIRTFTTYYSLITWQRLNQELQLSSTSVDNLNERIILYRKFYLELFNNENFLMDYSQILSSAQKLEESTKILHKATEYSGYYMIYLSIGINYFKLNNMKLAEKYLLTAVYMVPNRFVPKKYLMDFYLATKDYTKARLWCKNIINYKIKVESKDVNIIKEKASKILNKLSNLP